MECTPQPSRSNREATSRRHRVIPALDVENMDTINPQIHICMMISVCGDMVYHILLLLLLLQEVGPLVATQAWVTSEMIRAGKRPDRPTVSLQMYS